MQVSNKRSVLKKLLESEGISMTEARELRDEFRRGRGSLTKAEAEAIVEKTAEAEKFARLEPRDGDPHHVRFVDTNFGMQAKAKAELEVLDSQLEYVVNEFAHECSEARQHSLFETQEAWSKFRTAESEFAGLAWEGGSGAPLLALSRMVELTEQRIRDVRLAQAEANL